MFGFVCRVSAEMIFLRLRYRGNHFPLDWFTADLFPLGCVYVEIIFPRLSQPGKWLSASTLSEPKETKSNFSLCINYIYKHFRSILTAPYGLGVYAKNKKNISCLCTFTIIINRTNPRKKSYFARSLLHGDFLYVTHCQHSIDGCSNKPNPMRPYIACEFTSFFG